MKSEKIVREIVYKDELILEFADGDFVAHCFNEDDDIDTFTTKSLDKAKDWVDKHHIE